MLPRRKWPPTNHRTGGHTVQEATSSQNLSEHIYVRFEEVEESKIIKLQWRVIHVCDIRDEVNMFYILHIVGDQL